MVKTRNQGMVCDLLILTRSKSMEECAFAGKQWNDALGRGIKTKANKTNMKTSVIEVIESNLGTAGGQTNRRQALKKFGLGALGLGALSLFPQVASASSDGNESSNNNHHSNYPPKHPSDTEILNFALNLEYLEAEYYTYATTGMGIQALGVGVTGQGTQGSVSIKSNPQVPFATPAIQQYAMEIAADELNHVKLLRTVLGKKAVAEPAIDLQASFTAAAVAAGIIPQGQTFDPFADELSFLLGAFIFEDVGVTAYHGAAPLLHNKKYLAAAAGVLGVEAYHAATVRTLIYQSGSGAQGIAQQISDLRDSLDGTGDDDQGVILDGVANIVPTDANGLVYARTMAQVLAIAYFSPTATKGGFFPNGVNAGPKH
jgi:hypothetical protein